MSLNPELIPVKKDLETIRKEVLGNVIKMLNARGLIHDKNLKKHMDDIKKISEDDTYIFKLDEPFKVEQKDKKNPSKVDNLQVAVKIIHQKIQGSKIPIIKDFVTQYSTSHKIFIFSGMSEKARSSLIEQPNTEVFVESFLMVNILEHIDSPKYELLSEEEKEEVVHTYIVKKKELKKKRT